LSQFLKKAHRQLQGWNDYCRAAIFKDVHEPIVDRDTFEQVQKKIIKQSAVRRNRRMAKRASFLICCTAPTAVTSCGIMSTLSIKIYAFSPVPIM